MKKILILTVIFFACSSNKKTINRCNLSNAILIADKEVVEKGYKLDLLKKVISESDSTYIFQYYPKSLNVRGNAAEIIVSKKTCEISQKKLYQ